jgi:regulator of protease activity HflC (stomatin/prohibitin superfamily)
LHFGPPWLRVSHLVTRRAALSRHKIEGCLTKDGVSTTMDVSVVLRVMGDDPDATPGDDPDNVRRFAHEVTPFGLHSLLRAALEAEARTLARSVRHADVLGLRNYVRSDGSEGASSAAVASGAKRVSFSAEVKGRGGTAAARERGGGSLKERDTNRDDGAPPVASMMDAMKAVLNRQFKELGVEILEVIIRDITLPDAVLSQMTHRTMIICDNNIERMQRKVAVQSMLHEEEIRLKGACESDRAKLIAEGEYDATVARLGLDTLRAEGERDVQTIETQMHIDVELVKAENDLTVQRTEDETRLETERIRVQSESDAEALLAEAKNEVDAISAKGDLEVAKNVAKGEKGACVACLQVVLFVSGVALSPSSHNYDSNVQS